MLIQTYNVEVVLLVVVVVLVMDMSADQSDQTDNLLFYLENQEIHRNKKCEKNPQFLSFVHENSILNSISVSLFLLLFSLVCWAFVVARRVC